jgi:membrane associated rhomboid family serine protease
MTQTIGAFDLPPLSPTTRNLLIGLFVLYAVELVARNGLGLPVDLLAWRGFGEGFLPWQPASRYLIQGQGVMGVVFGGLVLYFLLPPLERWFSRRQLVQAIGAAALGGTALALALNGLGVVRGQTTGWAPLVTALLVLFGLHRPDAIIRLFFVLPVPAKVIAWGTGALSFLFLLASFDLGAADAFGTWAGAIGWWFWLGPGGRRRQLKRKSRGIERQLRVLDGGRDTFH